MNKYQFSIIIKYSITYTFVFLIKINWSSFSSTSSSWSIDNKMFSISANQLHPTYIYYIHSYLTIITKIIFLIKNMTNIYYLGGFFICFASSAFCLTLFSLTPISLTSARAFLNASNTLYFLSSSVISLNSYTGRGCLMAINGPLSCLATLQASGCMYVWYINQIKIINYVKTNITIFLSWFLRMAWEEY